MELACSTAAQIEKCNMNMALLIIHSCLPPLSQGWDIAAQTATPWWWKHKVPGNLERLRPEWWWFGGSPNTLLLQCIYIYTHIIIHISMHILDSFPAKTWVTLNHSIAVLRSWRGARRCQAHDFEWFCHIVTLSWFVAQGPFKGPKIFR